ncbi:peptidylprolyl isomerase [Xanthobacter sp. DSM 24535]|uniref:peptidylprolyl isomerase n=1 Tax=Roseixanthobacter psychrophilus TaxID=3119917 RepID=UPI00372ACEDD
MTDSATRTLGRRGILTRILRDPLLHFLIAGVLLFAAYSHFAPAAAPAADPMRIEITKDELKQLALVQLSQGQPLPDEAQLQSLAEQRAMQRILAREAASFGLERDDDIIERRLAQKMDFLLADLAKLEPPSHAELAAWYKANAARFTLPPRVSFRHLYFSPDGRGEDAARAAAAAALSEVADKPIHAPELSGIGDRFMFQDFYGGRTPEEIGKEFGPNFAQSLLALKPGAWYGPIQSGYGWHLVRIDTLEPSRVPALDEIEPDVRAAWTDERYNQIRKRAEDDMRARYTVVIPKLDPADLTNLGPRPLSAISSGEMGE